MKSIKQWYYRWKLRRVIAALAHRTSVDRQGEDAVYAFAKMLEGTEIMTRGLKKDDEIALQCTRKELDQFIRYMTTLHDSRLSLLIRARIGLATLAVSDKEILGEEPEETMKTEHARAIKGRETSVVDARGKKIRIKV